MSPQEAKKAMRKFSAMLRNRAKRVPTARMYRCLGGPFAGQQLALRTGTTCNLTVKGFRGRYIALSGWEVRWHENT